MKEPKIKNETFFYVRNVNHEEAERDRKQRIGSPKRTTIFSRKNTGQDLSKLISYQYALNFRDQGVADKPNRLDHSFLSADGRTGSNDFFKKQTDITKNSYAVLRR